MCAVQCSMPTLYYFPQGALLCLAAATVGLGDPSEAYLRQIVPPVLASFTDQDSRVRYYACEALYNIAKVRTDPLGAADRISWQVALCMASLWRCAVIATMTRHTAHFWTLLLQRINLHR